MKQILSLFMIFVMASFFILIGTMTAAAHHSSQEVSSSAICSNGSTDISTITSGAGYTSPSLPAGIYDTGQTSVSAITATTNYTAISRASDYTIGTTVQEVRLGDIVDSAYAYLSSPAIAGRAEILRC